MICYPGENRDYNVISDNIESNKDTLCEAWCMLFFFFLTSSAISEYNAFKPKVNTKSKRYTHTEK